MKSISTDHNKLTNKRPEGLECFLLAIGQRLSLRFAGASRRYNAHIAVLDSVV
jgi:hypothetical protein